MKCKVVRGGLSRFEVRSPSPLWPDLELPTYTLAIVFYAQGAPTRVLLSNSVGECDKLINLALMQPLHDMPLKQFLEEYQHGSYIERVYVKGSTAVAPNPSSHYPELKLFHSPADLARELDRLKGQPEYHPGMELKLSIPLDHGHIVTYTHGAFSDPRRRRLFLLPELTVFEH